MLSGHDQFRRLENIGIGLDIDEGSIWRTEVEGYGSRSLRIPNLGLAVPLSCRVSVKV